MLPELPESPIPEGYFLIIILFGLAYYFSRSMTLEEFQNKLMDAIEADLKAYKETIKTVFYMLKPFKED